MKSLYSILLILILWFAETVSGSWAPGAGGQSEENRVASILERLDRALEAGDLETASAFFHQNSDVISIGIDGREKAVGWSSLALLMRAQKEGIKNLRIMQKDLTVRFDAASGICRYFRTIDISFISQHLPFAVSGARETGVLLRSGEEWKIVQQHVSAPVTDDTWPAFVVPAELGWDSNPLTRKFPPALLQADFDLLRQALEEAHAGMYNYTSREEFNRLFNDTAQNIREPMAENEFLRLVTPLIESIHCLHTSISPSNEYRKQLDGQKSFLPIDLVFKAGRSYALRHLDKGIPVPAGSEILAINGMPMAKITARLLGTIPSDGFIVTWKYRILDRDFPELYSLYIGCPESFRVDYMPPGEKKSKTAVLSPVTEKVLNSFRPGFDEIYKKCLNLEIVEEKKTAVMTIKTFVPGIIERWRLDFHNFLDSSFSELTEKGIERLVLDLRGNDGGDSGYLTELLTYLINEPFRFLDRVDTPRVRYSFLEYTDKGIYFNRTHYRLWERDAGGGYRLRGKWGKTYSPKDNCFPGKLAVLIDGWSISAAADAAALLHDHKRAVFVGEETGGGYRGNNSGDFLNLTLPITKLRVRIPIRRSFLAVGGDPFPGRGVLPDYPLEPSLSDLLSGRDPVKNLAIQLIQK